MTSGKILFLFLDFGEAENHSFATPRRSAQSRGSIAFSGLLALVAGLT